jgi:hypothetical protein
MDIRRAIRVGELYVAGAPFACDAVLDEVPGFRHPHVRVNVDNLHTPAIDDDFTPLAITGRRGGGLSEARGKAKRRFCATAACENDSPCCP